MEFERPEKQRLKIGLTPLIDMVFLLVVFFMLTTTFSTTEVISLDFSSGDVAPAEKGKDDSILLSVEKDNIFYINGKKLDQITLRRELSNILKDGKKRTMILQWREGSNVQNLVNAMDIGRIAGGSKRTSIDGK